MGRGQRFCFLYGGKMVWDVDGWSGFLEVIFLSFCGGKSLLGYGYVDCGELLFVTWLE